MIRYAFVKWTLLTCSCVLAATLAYAFVVVYAWSVQ
jgi:hypothetical protein